VLATVLTLGAQARPNLNGRWVRVEQTGPGLEDVDPSWEEITTDASGFTLRRSAQPDRIERYTWDDGERAVLRYAQRARTCRARWEGAALVLECRQIDTGPGGEAPPIYTREIRQLDADGRLLLDVMWRSGDLTTNRRNVYRPVKL
jgi:hypothetical protein